MIVITAGVLLSGTQSGSDDSRAAGHANKQNDLVFKLRKLLDLRC